MGFQQTLRWVQTTRAIAITCTCISVIMFAYIIDMRFQARKAFLDKLKDALPGAFKDELHHSSIGSLALVGLPISLAWNGLCMFDLCVKKHYRFDRRVCIFLDMIVCIALLITGFLNFSYDLILYYALQIAPRSQVRLEIAAIIFLSITCVLHLAFFCYGCKDPAAQNLDFEQVPLAPHSPNLAGRQDHDALTLRGRGDTLDRAGDLVEIDLGKKVQILKLHPSTPVESGRRTPRSPGGGEVKRGGFIGAPAVLGGDRRTPSHEPATDPFSDPTVKSQEWI